MTNYNKRLGKALEQLAVAGRGWGVSESAQIESMSIELAEAKQAITSLIKELVAEAKPKTTPFDNNLDDGYATDIRSNAINEFEQNLLKALEDKL